MTAAPISRRAALAGAAGLALAGCAASPGDDGTSSSPSRRSASSRPGSSASPVESSGALDAPVLPLVIAINTAHGLTEMWPHEPIDITVENGSIAVVVVTDASGVAVPGAVTSNQWRPDRGALLVHTSYQVDVTATDAGGQDHLSSASITTVNPAMVVEVDFRYADGYTIGNGMPIWVRFDLPINDDQRAAIERRATVTTEPAQEGSWGWADATTLFWRPRAYWAPGSRARVEVRAAGLPGGDTWILHDAAANYIYGDQRVLQANIDTHSLTCLRNGEVVATLPVSMGKPGYETMTGTKVIMDKQNPVIMDSETYGVPHSNPEGYRIVANYAQRITWSGEYFHSAPWADADHGYANVSHGCTGMSEENAVWLYGFTEIGDPAEFTGSTARVQPHQTIGCWTYTWEQWQGQSALQ